MAFPTVKFFAVLFAVAEMGDTAAFTVKLTVLVVLATTPLESFTKKSTLAAVDVVLGVPDTIPVLASRLRPSGNVPEETL